MRTPDALQDTLQALVGNDLTAPGKPLFALAPQFMPDASRERLLRVPLSLIIGEHPSDYSVSPLMWNAEYQLCGRDELFLPADIPATRPGALTALLNKAVGIGSAHFRVLSITNPYKIEALGFFADLAESRKNVYLEKDARQIGATNQILIGPDNSFHVINSDGRGMLNAVETFLADRSQGALSGKSVGLIGAGGAARGIGYELAKRLKGTGSLMIYNRTLGRGVEFSKELSAYFPDSAIEARPLGELAHTAAEHDVLISAITGGDPLADTQAYRTLSPDTLVVDANYGANSLLARHAKEAGRDDLAVYDGAGMVVEGYIIPSQELAKLWGYEVPYEVYRTIGAIFGYTPKAN